MTRRPDGQPADRLRLADFAPREAEVACQFHDPELWHSEDRADVDQAKLICLTCPFMVQCLDYAMATNQLHGTWGGMEAEERMALRRGLGKPCPRCGGATKGRVVYDTDECRAAAKAEHQLRIDTAGQDRRVSRKVAAITTAVRPAIEAVAS